MAKYEAICDLIEKRVRLGDYALKELPVEERLAMEVGVSRMTARRAVLRLVEKGVLTRKPNGRVTVNRQYLSGGAPAQLAMLMPAFVSPSFQRWQASAEHVASKMEARLRKVDFVHWDDPTIAETLDGFDGVFLVPGAEPVPAQVMQRFQQHQDRLVVLDADWSAQGIRCIDLSPPRQIRDLLDHLLALGHRKIACLNTQPHDGVIRSRMAERAGWEAQHGLDGRLIDDPVAAFQDPMAKSFEVIAKFLQARQPDFTAIVSTTMASALGAMRAFHESGLKVGRDVSLAAVNDEGMARYLNPTLTSTQMPDPEPFLAVGFEWLMGRGGTDWGDRFLLQPSGVSVFVGESTGPCRA